MDKLINKNATVDEVKKNVEMAKGLLLSNLLLSQYNNGFGQQGFFSEEKAQSLPSGRIVADLVLKEQAGMKKFRSAIRKLPGLLDLLPREPKVGSVQKKEKKRQSIALGVRSGDAGPRPTVD